ncbi:hypothetical protein R1flu_001131 [Riccia fluitans]|uniref:Sidoreflexin n=1 Tax=Riccia fluitans TaxID=41844 RepID=A0ABD1Y2R8_9MARC
MDEETYLQRVTRIFNMMDIRTAVVTDAEVDAAVKLLRDREAGKVDAAEEQLNRAQKLKDAVVHPDTGEKIFLPLRLSFIIPCNLILDTLMLSARGFAQNVGAQFLNQTYNCAHYYANRNASNEEGVHKIFEAYMGATASSVGTVLGLHALVDKVPKSTPWKPIVRRMVPFCAVAAADFLNLGITRRNEVIHGIKVMDSNGDELGHSRKAGVRAVGACIAGRIAAAAPILVIPPLILHRLEKTKVYIQRPNLRIPTLMAMVAFSIQVSVPLCIGVFQQHAVVSVRKLEDELQGRVDRFGNPITHVYYNKGV